jgi:tetratricopeptide (TPR) repeat protein
MLLERSEVHPFVEITLRHHYSLTLRALRDLEAAVEQAKKAYDLEPTNAASAHVLGLAYEAKALVGWKKALTSGDAHAFARARVDEEEATAFFRQTRDQQPTEEYGYESEARYLKRKAELFTEPRNRNRVPQNLDVDGTTALARGLRLLHEAELRVHHELLVETPLTKARLLSQMGEFDKAWTLLQQLIAEAEDSVNKNKIRELAASLAATHKRWKEVREETTALIESGVRSPYVYLILDDALAALSLQQERRRWAAESANEWNREDVEALLRWAGILTEAQDWQAAAQVLERAQRAAQRLGLSTLAQLQRRGTARSSTGRVLRVAGYISRLFRPYEGLIQPLGSVYKEGIFFHNPEQPSHPLEIGDEFEFSVSWRIRGLRADDLQRRSDEESKS